MPTPSARRDELPGRQAPGVSAAPRTAWRQPVVWLGVVIFLASLIGCILTIVLASRHDDPALGHGVEYLMKVPLERVPAPVVPERR